MIDPHVHLRDWNQKQKETLKHAFTVAWRAGIVALFEMPNTDPPLTAEETILRRIADADAARRALRRTARPDADIFHGLYAGITADARQLSRIVALQRRLFPRVVGLKFYAGHSTGRMGVVSLQEQRGVWSVLAGESYTGVVAIHAETEELLRPERYDPSTPRSHSRARPPEAEIDSIHRHIDLARAAGFQGSIHFCHVSTPEGIDAIAAARGAAALHDTAAREGEVQKDAARASAARDAIPFRLRAGVTPQHLLLNEEVARRSPHPEWLVNPPLRDEERRWALRERLLAGKFDWIESDHAPHTFHDKLGGAAGLPGLPAFRLLRDRLLEEVGPEETERLTHQSVVDAFGIDGALFPGNDNSTIPYDFEGEARAYPWNPYRFLK